MVSKKKSERILKNTIALLLLSLLFLQIIQSCKKEKEPNPVPTDYRSDFTGNFQFTVCNTNWSLGLDTVYVSKDTVLINGNISQFRNRQLLIKYDTTNFMGLWLTDTADCSKGFSIGYIADSLINNPPNYSNFWGYWKGWVSPDLNYDSTMDIKCIPFDLSGGGHLVFGGYFINVDSVFLHYSQGLNGAGSLRDVYGRRHY